MPDPRHITFCGQPLPVDISTLVETETAALGLTLEPIQFDFTYRDIRVACRCEDSAGETATLKLVGNAGVMPFTAESPLARAAIQQIVLAANDALGRPLFRLAHGHILLGSEAPLPRPVSATKLVSAIVAFLIPARPYLDIIAEVVRPPLAPGDGGLRPEWRRRGLPAQPVSARGR